MKLLLDVLQILFCVLWFYFVFYLGRVWKHYSNMFDHFILV